MKKRELKKLVKESENRSNAYKRKINEAEKSFRELNSPNMQGTLIQLEDFLDSNHLYAFENWIDGVLYDGPNVKRYWVDVTLKYPYESMPDPRGGLRLSNMDARVLYKQSSEWVPVKVEGPDDLDPRTRKPKEEERKVWLVNIRVPRRFIEDAIEDEPQIVKPKEEAPAEGEPKAEEEAPPPAAGEGGEDIEAALGGEV